MEISLHCPLDVLCDRIKEQQPKPDGMAARPKLLKKSTRMLWVPAIKVQIMPKILLLNSDNWEELFLSR